MRLLVTSTNFLIKLLIFQGSFQNRLVAILQVLTNIKISPTPGRMYKINLKPT